MEEEIEIESNKQSSLPAQSARMHHNLFNSEEYFKIKEGATQQVLFVHDTDSIDDETTRFSNAPINNHASMFSQSQTDLRGNMPKMVISP